MQDKRHAAWTLTFKQPNRRDNQCDEFCLDSLNQSQFSVIDSHNPKNWNSNLKG
jgi:hypothetical protein